MKEGNTCTTAGSLHQYSQSCGPFTVWISSHLLDPCIHLKKSFLPAIVPTQYNKSFNLQLLANHVQPNTRSYHQGRKRRVIRYIASSQESFKIAKLTQIRFGFVVWSDLTTHGHSSKGVHHWDDRVKELSTNLTIKDTYIHLVYALQGLAIIFHLAHIVKVHIDSLGACFLQCLLNGWDGLVVVGCIKAKLFQVCNFRVTASKSCDHYKWNKYTLLQCTIHAYWHIYTVCYRQPHRQHGSLWSSPTGQQWIQQHQLLHWQQGSALPWAPGVQTDQSMPSLCGVGIHTYPQFAQRNW